MEYAGKLEKERDISYGDLKKQKGRYDAACQEVENRRKKTESSFDHGKTKAQNAYQQQIVEMHNVKVGPTNYLIGTADHEEHVHYQHQCHQQAEGEILLRVRPRSARRKKSGSMLRNGLG